MKLKQIQLQGFKTFVERTVLDFTDHISCVVGPNGCGKSNIVDAIRWAMGEMSAKTLRGGSMEDVIFHGSDDMGPVGMAEVTLIFDNAERLAPPEYADCAEIQITRRLFRSGESEYYINRVPVRLKDITDLFLGSGAGTRAYSVIAQGRIDEIVTMKPEQRRALIEEAAGVSKYRVRRLEATRKMDATRQNLLRVKDITTELQRQMNSLRRQAKKAERYKEYRQELKRTELEIAAFRAREIRLESEKIEKSLADIMARELEIQSGLEKAESEIESERAEMIGLERTLSSSQALLLEASREVERDEHALLTIKHQRESMNRDLERVRAEIGELKGREKSIAEESASLKDEKEALEKDIASAGEDVRAAAASKEEKDRAYRELIEASEVLEKHALGLKAKIEKLEARLEWGVRRKEELKDRGEKLEERKQKVEAGMEERARANISYNEKLYKLKRELEEHQDKLANAERVLAEARSARARLDEELKSLQAEHAGALSRLMSLQEMQKNFEGYQDGVKSIMARKDKLAAEGRNGTYSLITEVIKTEPDYELALEALLGERLQTIMVKDHEHGLDNIRYLRKEGAGRSSFAPLEGFGAARIETPPALREMGAVALAEKVSVEPKFEPVVKALIGDALVVDDIEAAARARREAGAANSLVTRDGIVLDRLGVLAGGSADAFSGFLKKKREVEELSQKVRDLASSRDSARTRLAESDEKIKELAAQWEQLKERSHRLEIEKNNHQKDLRQGTDLYNSMREEMTGIETDMEAAAESIMDVEREAEGALIEIENDKAALEKVNSDLSDRKGNLARLRAERDAEGEKLTSAQVKSAGLVEKLQSLNKHSERLGSAAREVKLGVEKREKEIEEIAARIGFLDEDEEKALAKREASSGSAADLEKKLEKEREDYGSRMDGMKAKEDVLKSERSRLNEVRNQKMETELARSQLKMKMENLSEKVSDKFFKTIDEVLESMGDAVGPDYPIEEKRKLREETRDKLDRMGDVNLTAIEEFEELNERYTFLTNQEADLIQALENLDSTILKINSAYKRAFKSSFEKVNERFQEVFPKLFVGGKAFLQLTDPDNLLESGVEIMVQPPGKRMNTIALLSGGEKALTASALIIGLFLVKPSPFCLLDEVDAALDDVNVSRFLDIIKELAQTSQLVIITHNKNTMELGDSLYGVTMEKKGVSKIVSVKLRQAG